MFSHDIPQEKRPVYELAEAIHQLINQKVPDCLKPPTVDERLAEAIEKAIVSVIQNTTATK
jgi:hypothetical protein